MDLKTKFKPGDRIFTASIYPALEQIQITGPFEITSLIVEVNPECIPSIMYHFNDGQCTLARTEKDLYGSIEEVCAAYNELRLKLSSGNSQHV